MAEDAPTTDRAKIGSPLRRKEIARLIQGIGTFTDDVDTNTGEAPS